MTKVFAFVFSVNFHSPEYKSKYPPLKSGELPLSVKIGTKKRLRNPNFKIFSSLSVNLTNFNLLIKYILKNRTNYCSPASKSTYSAFFISFLILLIDVITKSSSTVLSP